MFCLHKILYTENKKTNGVLLITIQSSEVNTVTNFIFNLYDKIIIIFWFIFANPFDCDD